MRFPLDARALSDQSLDGLGELVDAGRTAVLGLVPGVAPPTRPSFEELAQAAAAVTDRLGFSRAVLGERIGISPTCGLAGATAAWARAAMGLVSAGTSIAEHPDAI